MPGPVSDSYDPEWGTAANGQKIKNNLAAIYDRVSRILGGRQPMFILDLVDAGLYTKMSATLTERQWRIIRFALERAIESV